VFLWAGSTIYICYRYLAPFGGWLQNWDVRVAIESPVQPGWPLAYPGIAAILQKPAQPQQMEGVIFYTVVFRMLERMGVHGQEIDYAISRVTIFQRQQVSE
jgi:hypothetical protein